MAKKLLGLKFSAGHAGGRLNTAAPLAAQITKLPKHFKQHVIWTDSYNTDVLTTYNFTTQKK